MMPPRALSTPLNLYQWTLRTIIPRAEYHQNRYGRELEKATAGRWLDIGAGGQLHGGWQTRPQREVAAGATYLVGCDLELAQLARNPFLQGAIGADAEDLPFSDNSFDLVTANMVLEHLEEPRRVIIETFRVLRPGGHFVFVTPNKRHLAVTMASIVLNRRNRQKFAQRYEGRSAASVFPTYYRANTTTALRGLARDSGFVVIGLEVFSSFPIIRRPFPLTLFEALWIRAVMGFPALREFGSNIIGRLEKPATK
jgi:ubiquinone/menaquinone biosynthesis C-methylase UbiE